MAELMKMFKYTFNIKGRSTRRDYWMINLIQIVFTILHLFWLNQIGLGILIEIYSMITFIPYITLCIRRMQDINKSGWWTLTLIVPIIFYILSMFDSVDENNKYGDILE